MSDIDSSDSELNRAIALSLQDFQKPETVDLLSEDEVIDVDSIFPQRSRPTRGASLEGTVRHLDTTKTVLYSHESRQKSEPPESREVVSRPLGLSGSERKKMEEERLARARKRNASSISPPRIVWRPVTHYQEHPASSVIDNEEDDLRENTKRFKTQVGASLECGTLATEKKQLHENGQEVGLTGLQLPRQLVNSRPATLADLDSNKCSDEPRLPKGPKPKNCNTTGVVPFRQQLNFLQPGIHFPNGTVKKTWAYGYPRKDDIKIEEVLQKDDLEVAVLSAYQWDEDWILRKLNLSRTRVICVVQAETEQQKAEMRANVPQNIKFCFPSMAGQINCMHSKLQLLSHPTHLRVVVPSANLVPYDWGEDGGIMENTVFIIDLPRLQNGKQTTVQQLTPFGRELRNFLMAMEMELFVVESMLNFDFSNTIHLAFIHSIGGSHTGLDWKCTGYCGLGSAIRELDLATKNALEIDFLSASIGNLSNSFVKSIYLAAQGDDGTTELEWRSVKPAKNKAPNTQPTTNIGATELRIAEEIDKGFRIYFPSRDTVVSSKGGAGAGSTICFQSKWYDLPTFPRSLMRDCKSERPRMLMHNKILFVRQKAPDSHGGEDGMLHVAWAYVGSANLSESAWGRLVKDKATKQPKLNVRNWECGVVIPIPKPFDSGDTSSGKDHQSLEPHEFRTGQQKMDVFEGFVPVPMIVPGEEYGQRRPWFYAES